MLKDDDFIENAIYVFAEKVSGEEAMKLLDISSATTLKALFCDLQTQGLLAPELVLWWESGGRFVGRKQYQLRVMANKNIQVSATRLQQLGINWPAGSPIQVKASNGGFIVTLVS